MTCDERKDQLLLYVSDALEADEAAELREHLQTGCPACAGHLAEAQSVMASLPLALDPIAPPANLKAKLMQRIDAESAKLPPSRQPDFAADSLPIRLFRYFVPAAIAAGIAIVLTHHFMVDRVNTQLALLQGQADAIRLKAGQDAVQQAMEIQQLRGQFQSQNQIVQLLQSPDVKLIHLDHTEFQPTASANLLWDNHRKQWAILTTGMKPAEPGQTYELWFVTDKGAFQAGEFDVDEKGNGSLAVNIPPNIGQLQTAAVTNEKAGGVAAPTGHFQVLGKLY